MCSGYSRGGSQATLSLSCDLMGSFSFFPICFLLVHCRFSLFVLIEYIYHTQVTLEQPWLDVDFFNSKYYGTTLWAVGSIHGQRTTDREEQHIGRG